MEGFSRLQALTNAVMNMNDPLITASTRVAYAHEALQRAGIIRSTWGLPEVYYEMARDGELNAIKIILANGDLYNE